MRTAVVTYDNGEIITTQINGTDKEIKDYFATGKYFNIGNGEHDLMACVVRCKVI